MKSIFKRLRVISLIYCLSIVGASELVLVQNTTAQTSSSWHSSYLYVNGYPQGVTPSWGDNDYLTNGITHDDDNWYISSIESDIVTGMGDDKWTIWRIPVSEDINQDFDGHPLVTTIRVENIPGLWDAGYGHHIGDIDYYEHSDGTGYLLAPVTGGSAPAIAFFLAESLTFVNYAIIPGQKDVGWVAVNSLGELYTSSDFASHINRYSIDWLSLGDTQNHGALTYEENFRLLDLNGSEQILHHMQGGTFTPDDKILYVTSGIFEFCLLPTVCFGEIWPEDGLHAFDTSYSDWKEIQRSSKQSPNSSPYFLYQLNNDDTGDEAEGLTYWDLEDGRAPNVRGQLHVILYNHAVFDQTDSDVVSLKHYTNKIRVNASAPPPTPPGINVEPPLFGTKENPFNSINNALNWYPVWGGAEIVIGAGSYPETGVYSKQVRLVSEGGRVVIGQ